MNNYSIELVNLQQNKTILTFQSDKLYIDLNDKSHHFYINDTKIIVDDSLCSFKIS